MAAVALDAVIGRQKTVVSVVGLLLQLLLLLIERRQFFERRTSAADAQYLTGEKSGSHCRMKENSCVRAYILL